MISCSLYSRYHAIHVAPKRLRKNARYVVLVFVPQEIRRMWAPVNAVTDWPVLMYGWGVFSRGGTVRSKKTHKNI